MPAGRQMVAPNLSTLAPNGSAGDTRICSKDANGAGSIQSGWMITVRSSRAVQPVFRCRQPDTATGCTLSQSVPDGKMGGHNREPASADSN